MQTITADEPRRPRSVLGAITLGLTRHLPLEIDERRRWALVLGTLSLALVGGLLSATLGLGWKAASALAAVLLCAFSLHAVIRRDAVIARLMLFGLVVGFAELPADAFGVTTTRTLVYWPGGPFLWDSPLYMPLSWLTVIAQLGFIGSRLVPRYGALRATLGLAIFGGINIPLYEFIGRFARYWYYQNTPLLLGVTPHYVILAEALLSLTLPLFASWVISARPGKIVALGLAQALWIYVAGRIAYALVG